MTITVDWQNIKGISIPCQRVMNSVFIIGVQVIGKTRCKFADSSNSGISGFSVIFCSRCHETFGLDTASGLRANKVSEVSLGGRYTRFCHKLEILHMPGVSQPQTRSYLGLLGRDFALDRISGTLITRSDLEPFKLSRYARVLSRARGL